MPGWGCGRGRCARWGPGTFATDALRPGTVVELAHGVLLTGGSLFGLAAATGVMRYLEERSVGAVFGTVPIPGVVGQCCSICSRAIHRRGRVPRMGMRPALRLPQSRRPAPSVPVRAQPSRRRATHPNGALGGVGIASARVGEALVCAVMAANSVGGIWDDELHEWVAPLSAWDPSRELLPGANTTIGVVVTDAKLTKEQANRVATVAHDGIARAVRPAHTMYDGDTIFCIATGTALAPYDAVEVLAAEVVARAIAEGVRDAGAG